jgi:hypothetical protein
VRLVSGFVTLVQGAGKEVEGLQPRCLKLRRVSGVVGERMGEVRTGWWFGFVFGLGLEGENGGAMGVGELEVWCLDVDAGFDEDRYEVVVDFLVKVEDESFVLVLLVPLLEDERAGFEVELVFLSDEVVLVVFGVDDAFLVDELDSLDDVVEVVEGVECEVLLDEEVVLLLVVGANPKVYTST